MINVVYKDGLLFTSLEIQFRGKSTMIDDIVIDTGAAETIISPDAVEEIGITAEHDDYIHSSYGIGGSLHNFYMKQVDGLRLGGVNLSDVKLNIGIIDPHGHINGLLGLDLLMKLNAVIDLKQLTLLLDAP